VEEKMLLKSQDNNLNSSTVGNTMEEDAIQYAAKSSLRGRK